MLVVTLDSLPSTTSGTRAAASAPSALCAHAYGPLSPLAHLPSTDHRGGGVVFHYFVVGCFVVVAVLLSFSYMTAHAPPGIGSELALAADNCSWWVEAQRINPTGCIKPRFRSRLVDQPALSAEPGSARDTCGGALVDYLFDEHAGDDARLQLDEATPLARAITARVSKTRPCEEAGAKPHVCFAHATRSNEIVPGQAGAYVGCLVGHLPSACQAKVCA